MIWLAILFLASLAMIRLATLSALAALVALPAHASRELYSFCARHPSQCTPGPSAPVQQTPALMRLLSSVNADVQRSVRYADDAVTYGAVDWWTLPTNGRGDCEDIALEKRRRLIAAGLSPGVLLLTVVKSPLETDFHLVLTVVTTGGNLTLDSKRTARAWNYRTILQQSATNPAQWGF